MRGSGGTGWWPTFWRGFCGVPDLAQPRDNVHCGALILASFVERCGDVQCALESYNVGPRAARQASSRGARQRYVAKVDASLALFGTSREQLVL